MTDPKRWADGSDDASAVERELFRTGRAAGMPPEEKRRHWMAIAERAALIPTPAPPAHALPAKAAAKGLAHAAGLKAIAAVTVLVGAGAGTYFVAHSNASDAREHPRVSGRATSYEPAPRPSDVPAAPRLQERPPDVSAAQEPRERTVIARAPASHPASREPHQDDSVAPPGDETGSTRKTAASRLAEEAQGVLEARGALESGDPGRALSLLDVALHRFAAGSLGQEREALTIEALAQTGHRAVARERARAFLNRFPKSPHASNVSRFLSEP